MSLFPDQLFKEKDFYERRSSDICQNCHKGEMIPHDEEGILIGEGKGKGQGKGKGKGKGKRQGKGKGKRQGSGPFLFFFYLFFFFTNYLELFPTL